MAMPALAPVDSPELSSEEEEVVPRLEEESLEGMVVGGEEVFDAVADTVEDEEEVVEEVEAEVVDANRARSFSWNSTVIGCPHIVKGPVTVVLDSSVAPARAMTSVVPLNVLRQPMNNTELPVLKLIVLKEVA